MEDKALIEIKSQIASHSLQRVQCAFIEARIPITSFSADEAMAKIKEHWIENIEPLREGIKAIERLRRHNGGAEN